MYVLSDIHHELVLLKSNNIFEDEDEASNISNYIPG